MVGGTSDRFFRDSHCEELAIATLALLLGGEGGPGEGGQGPPDTQLLAGGARGHGDTERNFP